MRTYSSMPHLNGNLLCAVDLETTGVDSRLHEPVQIAVVPLDSDFRPLDGVTPFYTNMKPQHPERADRSAEGVHGLNLEDLLLYAPDRDKVADMFCEWVEKLDLPFEKCLVPLAHNWQFEYGFLTQWLGAKLRSKIFHGHYRDSMELALTINDRAFMQGQKQPFNSVGLKKLCDHFGIVNLNPHDAYSDSVAGAQVYRALLMSHDV